MISYDEQIRRANSYLAIGVDLILPMMLQLNGCPFAELNAASQMEHIARTAADIDGPIMYVGPPPAGYRAQDLAQAGVKLITHSAVTLEAAANAMKVVLEELRDTGLTVELYQQIPRHLPARRPLLDLMRVQHYLDLETRYPHGSAPRE